VLVSVSPRAADPRADRSQSPLTRMLGGCLRFALRARRRGADATSHTCVRPRRRPAASCQDWNLVVVCQDLPELVELSHAFGYPPVLPVDGVGLQHRSDQHAEGKQLELPTARRGWSSPSPPRQVSYTYNEYVDKSRLCRACSGVASAQPPLTEGVTPAGEAPRNRDLGGDSTAAGTGLRR
jgi:hypothetical protein